MSNDWGSAFGEVVGAVVTVSLASKVIKGINHIDKKKKMKKDKGGIIA